MSNELASELQRAVGRMEGKLDSLLETLPTAVAQNTLRITSLERWKAYTLGAGACAGLMLSAVWHVFTALLHAK